MEDLDDVSQFPEPTQLPILKSCGSCGAPLGPNDEPIKIIPENYNPDIYEHSVCPSCAYELVRNERMYATHEMALDAGDLSLEGTEW